MKNNTGTSEVIHCQSVSVHTPVTGSTCPVVGPSSPAVLHSHCFGSKRAWARLALILHVHIVYLCLCSRMSNRTVPQHTSSSCARSEEVYVASAWYWVLTLVRQTGLWGSNVPGPSVSPIWPLRSSKKKPKLKTSSKKNQMDQLDMLPLDSQFDSPDLSSLSSEINKMLQIVIHYRTTL